MMVFDPLTSSGTIMTGRGGKSGPTCFSKYFSFVHIQLWAGALGPKNKSYSTVNMIKKASVQMSQDVWNQNI